jgi:cytochrome c2
MLRHVSAAKAAAMLLALCAGSAVAQEQGDQAFKRSCAVCHTTEAGKNKIGPSLAGIVGRKAGSVERFSYSDANRKSGITWDAATLDQYLTDPRKFMPGTKMVFIGLKKSEDRQAVIDWLAQQK